MPDSQNENFVYKDQLMKLHNGRRPDPHVVILGAGASKAAFPNGDANGKCVPLMNELIKVVGLKDLFEQANLNPNENFESLYSQLHTNDPQSHILKQIEQKIEDYFIQLSIPSTPTLYDQLVLSLTEKDAIFTFNWDPFLVDTIIRHSERITLPQIFHLHGNVRVGLCKSCKHPVVMNQKCLECNSELIPSKLLYPIENKNYSDNPFVKSQWDAASEFIQNAIIFTIFGYSAPVSDKNAMEIITKAWKNISYKLIKRVEIIDTKDKETISSQWHNFAHYYHYDPRKYLSESFLARYPRRSCEALFQITRCGNFVEDLPWAKDIYSLYDGAQELYHYELMHNRNSHNNE